MQKSIKGKQARLRIYINKTSNQHCHKAVLASFFSTVEMSDWLNTVRHDYWDNSCH